MLEYPTKHSTLMPPDLTICSSPPLMAGVLPAFLLFYYLCPPVLFSQLACFYVQPNFDVTTFRRNHDLFSKQLQVHNYVYLPHLNAMPYIFNSNSVTWIFLHNIRIQPLQGYVRNMGRCCCECCSSSVWLYILIAAIFHNKHTHWTSSTINQLPIDFKPLQYFLSGDPFKDSGDPFAGDDNKWAAFGNKSNAVSSADPFADSSAFGSGFSATSSTMGKQ